MLYIMFKSNFFGRFSCSFMGVDNFTASGHMIRNLKYVTSPFFSPKI
jgi:hypothetical protein